MLDSHQRRCDNSGDWGFCASGVQALGSVTHAAKQSSPLSICPLLSTMGRPGFARITDKNPSTSKFKELQTNGKLTSFSQLEEKWNNSLASVIYRKLSLLFTTIGAIV